MNAPEPVTGRLILRERGPALPHELRWSGAGDPGYRGGGLRGRCDCGRNALIDGDQPVSKLIEAERLHAGEEP